VSAGDRRWDHGPITYDVYAAVTPGMIVAPGASPNQNLVGPAGANAVNWMGVATTGGLPVGTSTTFTSPSGYTGLDLTVGDEHVAVGDAPEVYECIAGGTINFGDRVKCGANGTVVAWVAGTDAPERRVGKCVQVGGAVAGTGADGLANTVLVKLGTY